MGRALAGAAGRDRAEPRPTAEGAVTPIALDARGVRKRFGSVDVLGGVDVTVDADELVALVGENGTGKTTLVRCLAGSLEPDGGTIEVLGDQVTVGPPHPGLEIVWQDLALCGNLSVVDNLFLGREDGWRLRSSGERHVRAQALLDELDIQLPNLTAPVDQLSGGQRQSVAIARTLLTRPRLLVLDEPTAALGATGQFVVHQLIQRMRAEGVAILLISHDLDLVCRLADRALVLRDGRIADDVRRPRLEPDELRALMSGLDPDGAARAQLHRLRALVAQLSAVAPSAIVPLVVSALSLAVDHDGLAVHLTRDDGDLDLAGALGLPSDARSALERVAALGGSPIAASARDSVPIVAEDLRAQRWDRADELLRAGVRSTWTVPMVAGDRTLGTITGLGAALGPARADVIELATLYASQAASALDRDRLLGDLTRRNATLETLRQMLEVLAGPVGEDAGLAIALDAIQIGLGADDVALLDAGVPHGHPDRLRLSTTGDADWAREVRPPLPGTTATLVDDEGRVVLAATAAEEEHRYALTARWRRGDRPRDGAPELLADGVRAVRLALQRRSLEQTRQETAALRRSNTLQRTFLSRLSHELRTPLTAIHGYADTLRQPDIEWDHDSTRHFLDTIVRESGRLGNLVTDLLDASSIEAGVLQLQLDWCDLDLVVSAAVASVPRPSATTVEVELATGLPPIRADHDRLEQVLVNLVGNAVRHTPPGTRITIGAALADRGTVELSVSDDGPGLPFEVAAALFTPGVQAGAGGGAGLGLSISRGIVRAHGGTIDHDTRHPGTRFRILLPIEGPDEAEPAWAPGGDLVVTTMDEEHR